MEKKWAAKAYGVIGTASTKTENGITTYNPGKHGWFELKEFDTFEEADDWLCSYIRANGYSSSDFKVTRK